MSQRIASFRDLTVYKKAFDMQQRVFALSKRFSREELYALTDQIRRSSRGVGSNIAEAWHKRRYEGHFVSKLTDSDAEQAETQHWLDIALACDYVSAREHRGLMSRCEEIGKMLGKMMAQPEKWCGRFAKR